jgi:hypothetical protein
MKTRPLLLVLAMFLIRSCAMDPCLVCELCNESKDTILVKLEYDTDFIKETRSDLSPKEILALPIDDSGMVVLHTDSMSFTKEFFVKPFSKIMMDGGNNPVPKMYFSKLKIFHEKDSVIVLGRENINKAFVKEHGFTYRLKIK